MYPVVDFYTPPLHRSLFPCDKSSVCPIHEIIMMMMMMFFANFCIPIDVSQLIICSGFVTTSNYIQFSCLFSSTFLWWWSFMIRVKSFGLALCTEFREYPNSGLLIPFEDASTLFPSFVHIKLDKPACFINNSLFYTDLLYFETEWVKSLMFNALFGD